MNDIKNVYFCASKTRRKISKNFFQLSFVFRPKLIDCHLCRDICLRSSDKSFNFPVNKSLKVRWKMMFGRNLRELSELNWYEMRGEMRRKVICLGKRIWKFSSELSKAHRDHSTETVYERFLIFSFDFNNHQTLLAVFVWCAILSSSSSLLDGWEFGNLSRFRWVNIIGISSELDGEFELKSLGRWRAIFGLFHLTLPKSKRINESEIISSITSTTSRTENIISFWLYSLCTCVNI